MPKTETIVGHEKGFLEFENKKGTDRSTSLQMQRQLTMEEIIDQMVARWPSPVVARKAIGEFTGGTVSQSTMANEDSLGRGVKGRFLLMNQVVYPVENLGAWLKTRAATSWKTRKTA